MPVVAYLLQHRLPLTAAGAPAAPTASVTVNQPVLYQQERSLSLHQPELVLLIASMSNIYQYNSNIYGVAPGTYNVTVKDAGGCISAATQVTVNGAPGAPAAPTASATDFNQPVPYQQERLSSLHQPELVLLTASMEQLIPIPQEHLLA